MEIPKIGKGYQALILVFPEAAIDKTPLPSTANGAEAVGTFIVPTAVVVATGNEVSGQKDIFCERLDK